MCSKESRYGIGIYLCLFLSLNIVYLLIDVKLGFVKQISNDKEIDIAIC